MLALGLVVALFQPDALAIPRAPAAAVLAEVVWPVLVAQGPRGGWSPVASDAALQDPHALAQALDVPGVLWADVQDGAVRLHLFRAADRRVLEVTVGPADAPPKALAEATRLQFEFLLSAPRQGGRRWQARLPPAPRFPPISAATAAEFAPPAIEQPPERPRPVIPSLAAPNGRNKAGGTNGTHVSIERRADTTVGRRPWRLAGWVSSGPWVTADTVALTLGGTLAFPITERLSARLGADFVPQDEVAGVDTQTLSVRAGIDTEIWQGATAGALLGGVRYDRFMAAEDSAQRGAFYAGLGVEFLPQSPVSLGLEAVVGGSPWSLQAGPVDGFGHVDALARLRLGYRNFR